MTHTDRLALVKFAFIPSPYFQHGSTVLKSYIAGPAGTINPVKIKPIRPGSTASIDTNPQLSAGPAANLPPEKK